MLATPSSSSVIGTPDLSSPIRQIILNDRESATTESLHILPQMIGTDSQYYRQLTPGRGMEHGIN